jgi:hypothetical protein
VHIAKQIITDRVFDRSSHLDPYIKLARWLARSHDPFTHFLSVLRVGIQSNHQALESDEDEVEERDDDME